LDSQAKAKGLTVLQLREGQTYRISNLVTKQWTNFRCHELWGYRGHYVAYGEGFKHEIWLPSSIGHQGVPVRPVCFPAIISSDPEQLVKFCDQLFCALPLVLEQENPVTNKLETLAIPNQSSLPGWLEFGDSPHTINTERLKESAMKLIDVWYEWQVNGRMPESYTAAVALARAGAN
jgi:hypothetical protein